MTSCKHIRFAIYNIRSQLLTDTVIIVHIITHVKRFKMILRICEQKYSAILRSALNSAQNVILVTGRGDPEDTDDYDQLLSDGGAAFKPITPKGKRGFSTLGISTTS